MRWYPPPFIFGKFVNVNLPDENFQNNTDPEW